MRRRQKSKSAASSITPEQGATHDRGWDARSNPRTVKPLGLSHGDA